MTLEMKKHFIFELKLSWGGWWGNILKIIPSIWVNISTAPSISLQWIGLNLELWCGIISGSYGRSFAITPHFSFSHLNKRFKEKYDFQFSWLNISYRKFIGERVKYKTVLAEELKKPIDWNKIFKKINF